MPPIINHFFNMGREEGRKEQGQKIGKRNSSRDNVNMITYKCVCPSNDLSPNTWHPCTPVRTFIPLARRRGAAAFSSLAPPTR